MAGLKKCLEVLKMDRSDFIKKLKEANRFDILEKYNQFIKFQDAAIETLVFFYVVCEKYKIHYQLAFGSLLGAVRDNGQIPWDYDVDVLIDYNDRYILEEALRVEGNDKYYFVSPIKDKKYYLYMLRLSPIGFHSECAHVDVFYVIGSSNDDHQRKKESAEIVKLFNDRHRKLMRISDLYMPINLKSLIWFVGSKIRRMLVSNKKIERRFESLSNNYPIDKSQFCIIIYEGRYGNIYNKDWFINTQRLDTSIGRFFVPQKYEEVLNRFYGDYKKYPSFSSIIEEINHYFEILIKFQKSYEKGKH